MPEPEGGYRRYTLGELFEFATGDTDLQQKDVNGKGCRLVNSGLTNMGIKGMTDREARIFPANTITIDFWGNAFYRPFEYKMATHNHVFSLDGQLLQNEDIGLYVVGTLHYLQKAHSFNEMATIPVLQEHTSCLPLTSQGSPDHTFMTHYIRAIKKQVIARLKAEIDREQKAYAQATR